MMVLLSVVLACSWRPDFDQPLGGYCEQPSDCVSYEKVTIEIFDGYYRKEWHNVVYEYQYGSYEVCESEEPCAVCEASQCCLVADVYSDGAYTNGLGRVFSWDDDYGEELCRDSAECCSGSVCGFHSYGDEYSGEWSCRPACSADSDCASNICDEAQGFCLNEGEQAY